MDFSGIFYDLRDKLIGWGEALILMLPEFVVAIFVVFAAAVIARFARSATFGILKRTSSYATVNNLLATIVYIIVLGTGLFTALGILGLDRAVTSLLAGVGIVGLALGFAFQDLASNFIAGILLSIRRPFKEGDLIETNDHFGVVKEINLRSTKMRTLQGQLVIVPNADVFTHPVKNFSTSERRIDLEVGVAYGDDLRKVREVTLAAVKAVEGIRTDKPVDLYFTEFGDSSIDFIVRFWVDFARQPEYLSAKSEAIIAIKEAFDREGITIPFPIRTLDFSEVGGERLNQVLPPRLYDNRP
jgi:small conductance mechanosensitive channel